MATEPTRQTNRTQELPWRAGARAGAAAFGIVYVVMYLLTALSDIDPVFFDRWGQHNAAAWLMYSAHDVPLVPGGAAASIGQVNFIQSNADVFPVPDVLLYVIPAGVLYLAGRYVASNAGTRAATADRAAKEGATVVAGYLALTVLGVFVFSGSAGGGTLEPDLGRSVILMGVAYPVVLGAIGGWTWKNGRTDHHSTEGKRP